MTSDAHPANCACGCGCGDAPAPALTNPPGQPALAYRIGTHGTFLREMLARLPVEAIPDGANAGARPLAALTTRAADDPAVALLDAWATVADVLTFYQERIANEGFLRTATERRSVLELARAIGYELNPGVAAATFLAFTVEDAPGAPESVVVPQNTRVLSIPKPGHLPQPFESSAEITARAAWNALKPQLSQPQAVQRGQTRLYLKGVTTQLQPGDAILIVGDNRVRFGGSERWDFRLLSSVTALPEEGRTLLTLGPGLGHEDPDIDPADNPRVFAFRLRAALFGHNAPDWRIMPDSIKRAFDPDFNPNDRTTWGTQWPNFEIPDDHVDLDAAYPKVLAGSWVILSKPSYVELYRAVRVLTDSRTDFGLTAQVTRIEPDTQEHLSWFPLRDTVVYAQSEELALADEPVATPVAGNVIALDQVVDGLLPGQAIVVTGTPVDGAEPVSEVAFIDEVAADAARTTLTLSEPLARQYVRTTVTINANVVRATHGETVSEVLGSGDGAQTNQRFTLKKPPLTYVAAPTATGAVSTLTVRVNGIQWGEVPSLYGLRPDSEQYTIRIDNESRATLIFGDGKTGARLPTGPENVTAVYRSGIGPDGEVDAGSLTLLPARPAGIRSVSNPLPATGAAAPEQLEDARGNAPRTVLTLDRIVSLRDFEHFARAFAGVGKAGAAVLWNGEQRLVHLTVATASGDPVDPTSELYLNLKAGIAAAQDPVQKVVVASFEPVAFRLAAKVLPDARHVAADVLAAVDAALRAAFSFDERAFGQPVTAAEVITVIQNVPGVIAVDLDRLYRSDDATGPSQTAPAAVLAVATARWEGGQIRPAQLLLLDADPLAISLSEMTP